MSNFPKVNNDDVTTAPTQTSRHAIRTAGTTLYVKANISVTITKEIKISVHCQKDAVRGTRAVIDCVRAAVLVLMIKDSSKKKPTPNTMSKVISCPRTQLSSRRPGSGRTCHIALSVLCNSPKTPTAPSRDVTMPMIAENLPDRDRLALLTVAWSAAAISGPTMSCIASTI